MKQESAGKLSSRKQADKLNTMIKMQELHFEAVFHKNSILRGSLESCTVFS